MHEVKLFHIAKACDRSIRMILHAQIINICVYDQCSHQHLTVEVRFMFQAI